MAFPSTSMSSTPAIGLPPTRVAGAADEAAARRGRMDDARRTERMRAAGAATAPRATLSADDVIARGSVPQHPPRGTNTGATKQVRSAETYSSMAHRASSLSFLHNSVLRADHVVAPRRERFPCASGSPPPAIDVARHGGLGEITPVRARPRARSRDGDACASANAGDPTNVVERAARPRLVAICPTRARAEKEIGAPTSFVRRPAPSSARRS